ncbi:hypothetical protein [Nannocystis punicea]|uniref:Tetratricopeptide repeat-containing protein n=1 Tax=Nannocystis punicea TaxID=2995304 RepID=A0ABY7H2Q5_9BACT|nr:hypothetical protein [Nannocystis poenicansa]WAS93453.1 hypothetical protein O0S08_45545 [Nannocystis poenicansa]
MLQELVVYDNGGCSGVHLVDGGLDVVSLTARAALPKQKLAADEQMCVNAGSGEIPWRLPAELVVDGEGAAEEGDDTCTPMDGAIWQLHRGRLVKSAVGTDVNASCACHSWVSLAPKSCSSRADPCGRVEAFPSLAPRTEDFWIAGDETAALVLGESPAILTAGGRTRVRIRGFSPGERETVIGVRHHEDAAPLLRAGARALKPAQRVLPWVPVALRSTVALPPVPALAPEDVGLEERRGGRDWGNRCFAHFKAKRYDAAAAACARGLELARDESVRGAMYYSLGRVAEARGNSGAAVVYYRTSLVLRYDEETERRYRRLR